MITENQHSKKMVVSFRSTFLKQKKDGKRSADVHVFSGELILMESPCFLTSVGSEGLHLSSPLLHSGRSPGPPSNFEGNSLPLAEVFMLLSQGVSLRGSYGAAFSVMTPQES